MKLKIKSLTIICLLMPFLFIGQIKILKNIRPSVLANKEEKALFFIDFWATWCGPCINASKYLESLQQQYPDKFYVISISKEGPEAISRFAEKHDMKLAVVADYDGETFSENEVTSLPYGILFNADGHKLWEGHPADFKYYHLNGYLETNKKKIPINSFLNIQEYDEKSVAETVVEQILSTPPSSNKGFSLLEIEIVCLLKRVLELILIKSVTY